jgi:lincosamide nucleotidyltransferase A/C/D/E
MTADDALAVLDLLDANGVVAWLDGGWAVDAALETQRRPHDDLDLVVELSDAERVPEILARSGYVVARGSAPKSFELVDRYGRQGDVHPVRFTPDGDGLYVMEDGEEWVYPAAGFSGEGRILGRRVRCLTPEVQMLCHTGYEPHVGSYDDVWALSMRFDLEVPPEYCRSRREYAPRSP